MGCPARKATRGGASCRVVGRCVASCCRNLVLYCIVDIVLLHYRIDIVLYDYMAGSNMGTVTVVPPW